MAFSKKDFQGLEKINRYLTEIKVPCVGLDSRYPNVLVAKAEISLAFETCIDGNSVYCPRDYCLGRGRDNNDPCCVAQEHLKTIGNILQRGNATYNIGRQESCPLAGTSSDLTYTLVAVAIVVVLIISGLVWYIVKNRYELRRANRQITELKKNSSLPSVKPEDVSEDLESGINVSQFSSKASSKGLSTSRGSLNKKKIHGNPEEHEPCFQPEGKHKIYRDPSVR